MGLLVGATEGIRVGRYVGFAVGILVGIAVGALVIRMVGEAVGLLDGVTVGTLVGAAVVAETDTTGPCTSASSKITTTVTIHLQHVPNPSISSLSLSVKCPGSSR